MYHLKAEPKKPQPPLSIHGELYPRCGKQKASCGKLKGGKGQAKGKPRQAGKLRQAKGKRVYQAGWLYVKLCVAWLTLEPGEGRHDEAANIQD